MSLFSLRSCSCAAVGFRVAGSEGFVLVTAVMFVKLAGITSTGA